MAPTSDLIKGFKLLRLLLVPGSLVTRNLLVKRHASREAADIDSGQGNILFVTHLDNFVTEGLLQKCFSSFGKILNVEIKSSEKKAPRAELRADHVKLHVNFARIVFSDAASVDAVLNSADGRISSSTQLGLPLSTLKAEVKAAKSFYRKPAELQQEIDEWMANFDAREEEKQRQLEQEALVDEDGFQKVVSRVTKSDGFSIRSAPKPGLKVGAFSEPISGVKALSEGKKDRRTKKKKEREKVDFYKFQQREQRMQEVVQMRKDKKHDEEKVEQMRKAKRFKSIDATAK
eukprot:CAMPEP_0206480722 /NCGR_PEP_ID=MMETSP0324_2-20121206/37602_1 /ASSEMBLY_ACC=CAM_ASM_000836 /TAXON_ID=2866 /ORGANISM="Crypthecodinium cohnii, Strain Seligo" /LENGTH=288 /DNA_ID=CAMNT_0053957841 /DNA_START=26 /DNA_END=892 /DNA_ORIENTATION=+